MKLGDIVTLKSHPYSIGYTTIIISGDTQILSPLMLITEIVKEKQKPNGDTIKDTAFRKIKYKCLWYSNKSHQFEEKWIDETMIMPLKEATEALESNIPNGSLVTLKTFKQEAAKSKGSHASEEVLRNEYIRSESENISTTITPLLAFIPPVMQVCGVKNNDLKESCVNKKTGEVNKELTEWLVKCLWYNPVLEKFSEQFFPIEVLELIPEPSKLIEQVQNAILSGNCLEVVVQPEHKTVIKPKSIIFRNGIYYLRGYDYLLNKSIELKINDLKEVAYKTQVVKSSFPDFEFSEDLFKERKKLKPYFRDTLKRLINSALSSKNYLRLTYKNKNEKLSIRTLRHFKVEEDLLKLGNDYGDKIPYITGYCFLKAEVRTFKLDRILKLEVIDLEFD